MTNGISIIVLCYNDAPSLPGLVQTLLTEAAGWESEFELIIMDDCSRDGSLALAQELAERHDCIRVLRHEQNRGVGAAFWTAASAARGGYIGYIDGDGQYDPRDFSRLLQAMRQERRGAASGLRVKRADPISRTVISRTYRLVLRLLYGLRLRDVNSGIKLYRREFLAAAAPGIASGPFFDAEIMIRAHHAGHRVVELPVTHLPRIHGKAGGVSGRSLKSMLGSLLDPRFARYRRRWLLADESPAPTETQVVDHVTGP